MRVAGAVVTQKARRRQIGLLLGSVAGLAMILLPAVTQAQAPGQIRQELPARMAPPELLKPALDKVLSPQGRYVLLPQKNSVLVIDGPDQVLAAADAIASLELPAPEVALNFAFDGGRRPARALSPPTSTRGFPYPTAYDPPRILVNGLGQPVLVIPAHPRNFTRRDVGVVMETTPTLNPDGSVTVDINYSDTEFEGFINYGSGIFPTGVSGFVPVFDGVGNPGFFSPFLNNNRIQVPIFSTTRISTQIVLQPQVQGNVITVDMIPQLKVFNEADAGEIDERVISLTQHRTQVRVANEGTALVNGFKGASPSFNRHFLGGQDDGSSDGTTAIKISARLMPPGSKVAAEKDAAAAEPQGGN